MPDYILMYIIYETLCCVCVGVYEFMCSYVAM